MIVGSPKKETRNSRVNMPPPVTMVKLRVSVGKGLNLAHSIVAVRALFSVK
jgi:hypothetical protein